MIAVNYMSSGIWRSVVCRQVKQTLHYDSGVTRGDSTPPPQIPKVLQNRAKLNPIWKPLKIAEFGTPTLQYVRKKGSKILKLPWFAIVLH